MSLIIAARFETFDAAQIAAAALMDAGVPAESLHTFFVNPAGAHDRYPMGGDMAADPNAKGAPFGAVTGAAAVGVVGAIVGAVIGFTVADSMLPIIGGAGVGAYIGSLAGAMAALGKDRPRRSAREAAEVKAKEGRQSGVMLAVHTSPERESEVATILRKSGGAEVERARGRWQNGKWEDFDPLLSPELKKDF